MSEIIKNYSNEMRGSLWTEKNRSSDKAPTATGTLTISGVELRIALWPKKKAGGNGKRAGEEFWPVSVEYKQGTKFMLAKVNPANVVVIGAAATPEPGSAAADSSPEMPSAPIGEVGDMPF